MTDPKTYMKYVIEGDVKDFVERTSVKVIGYSSGPTSLYIKIAEDTQYNPEIEEMEFDTTPTGLRLIRDTIDAYLSAAGENKVEKD